MADKAVISYKDTPVGTVKVHRCPSCNAWDSHLCGEPNTPLGPKAGVYDCEVCGEPFEIVVEP